MASDSSEPQVPNVYAYRGRYLLSTYNDRNKDVPHHKLSELTPLLHNPEPTPNLPVCIIGAGMAGLYTAMIFESLGISYHIVDANTPERVGGQLFTYQFPNGGPNDYYDVGAMRFPDTSFMKRTLDLVRNRGLKDLKLLPYIMEMVDSPNTWLFYNNARAHNQDPSITGDPFNVKSYLTDERLATPQGVSEKVAEMLQPYRDLFRPLPAGQPRDIAACMASLLRDADRLSMRGYMLSRGMNMKDIRWCETVTKSTGCYERALTQTAIESLAYDWPTVPHPDPEKPKGTNLDWYCFDGGSSTLPRAMFASLSKKAQDEALFERTVTGISREKDIMRVSINGVQSAREYSAVVSTVPMPRLSLMDLTGVSIHDNYTQWGAVRGLQYGPAIKIGVKFSTPWWETLPKPIRGGQSYTDLPLRTIVYPSYPADAGLGNGSKVLIASYCLSEDADRLGALIHPDGTAELELIDLVFRDLAAVHGLEVDDIKKYYREGDYFAWDWLHDPLTMGGEPFFAPGVYGNADIYGAVLRPASRGKLFFAGEAASAANGWVAGALDSAWRAVDQYLALNQPERREDFWGLWGKTEYWDENSNKVLAELNHQLTDRHLVISLYKDGVMLEPM